MSGCQVLGLEVSGWMSGARCWILNAGNLMTVSV